MTNSNRHACKAAGSRVLQGSETGPRLSRIRGFFTILAICSVALGVTACLPGKEQEKKVLDRVTHAQERVTANKLAADMEVAARRHLLTAEATDSALLKTVDCGNGHVMAFVPVTAGFVRNGEMPALMATRLRQDLAAHGTVNEAAGAVAACPPASAFAQMIAAGSPVLMMSHAQAAPLVTDEDDHSVVEVTMAACPSGQPGVVITKVTRNADGTLNTQTDNRCGAAAPDASSMPQITLQTGSIPDYEQRLTTANRLAERNITCIAGANGCTPVPSEDLGSKIVCQDEPEKVDYIANPYYNQTARDFVPTAGEGDCGRPGWTGELAARVKKTECQVIRNGVAEEKPVTVFDVAFVGAQCRKKDVITTRSCPAGHGFAYTNQGRLTTREDLRMTGMVVLSPTYDAQSGQNISVIGYGNYPSLTWTNLGTEEQALVNSGFTLRRTNGNATVQPFYSGADVASSSNSEFDQNFVTELRRVNKIALEPNANVTCFPKAQDCQITQEPRQMVVALDRSAPMGNTTVTNTRLTHTACRATIPNLFPAENRVQACNLIRNWQAVHKLGPGFISYSNIDSTISAGGTKYWNYRKMSHYNANGSPLTGPDRDPEDFVTEAFRVWSQNYHHINSPQATTLNNLMGQLEGLMYDNNKQHLGRLKAALIMGHTCDLYPTAGYPRISMSEDVLGYCPQEKVQDAQALGLAGETAPSCQNTCPGECVTRLVRDDYKSPNAAANGQPQGHNQHNGQSVLPSAANAYAMAHHLAKRGLLARVPPKTGAKYLDIYKNEVRHTVADNSGKRLDELKVAYGIHDNATAIANRDADLRTMLARIETIHKTAVVTAPQNTESAIYAAIDTAIEDLRWKFLNADPNTPAAIVIMGGSHDTSNMIQGHMYPSRFTPPFMNGQGDYNHLSGGALDGNLMTGLFYRGPKFYSHYFGRNICNPEPVPLDYRCEWKKGNQRPAIVMYPSSVYDRGQDANNSPMPNKEYLNTFHGRIKTCADSDHAKAGSGASLIKYYVHDTKKDANGQEIWDNYHSLVGLVGRHYPNVKIFYLDLTGDPNNPNTLGLYCSRSLPAPNARHPHSYYNGKRVWYAYNLQRDGVDQFWKDIDNALGTSGEPDVAAGEQVCRAVFGNGVTMDYTDAANLGFVHSIGNEQGFCSKPLILDTATGDYVESSAKMIESPLSYTRIQPCHLNGFRPWTARSCTTQPTSALFN